MRISDWSSDVCSSDLAAPQREQVLALLVLRPPALRQVAEREVRPAAEKIAAVAADVADEAVALTHLWLAADRQSQSLGDDPRGVQGAPLGASDDAAAPARGEAHGNLFRLALALRG